MAQESTARLEILEEASQAFADFLNHLQQAHPDIAQHADIYGKVRSGRQILRGLEITEKA